MMKSGLLIVDVQRDFCPGGALPAPGGDEVIAPINLLMGHVPLIIASKDWHPAETVHFGKWPPHCIRGTAGAEFYPGLREALIDAVALKGTGNTDDGYSAFEATNLDLTHLLKKNEVGHLYVCGLATDYCVRATALDALGSGFRVTVVTDAVRAVNQVPGDGERSLAEMARAGIRMSTSDELLRSLI